MANDIVALVNRIIKTCHHDSDNQKQSHSNKWFGKK